jgi:hypothetical protein
MDDEIGRTVFFVQIIALIVWIFGISCSILAYIFPVSSLFSYGKSLSLPSAVNFKWVPLVPKWWFVFYYPVGIIACVCVKAISSRLDEGAISNELVYYLYLFHLFRRFHECLSIHRWSKNARMPAHLYFAGMLHYIFVPFTLLLPLPSYASIKQYLGIPLGLDFVEVSHTRMISFSPLLLALIVLFLSFNYLQACAHEALASLRRGSDGRYSEDSFSIFPYSARSIGRHYERYLDAKRKFLDDGVADVSPTDKIDEQTLCPNLKLSKYGAFVCDVVDGPRYDPPPELLEVLTQPLHEHVESLRSKSLLREVDWSFDAHSDSASPSPPPTTTTTLTVSGEKLSRARKTNRRSLSGSTRKRERLVSTQSLLDSNTPSKSMAPPALYSRPKGFPFSEFSSSPHYLAEIGIYWTLVAIAYLQDPELRILSPSSVFDSVILALLHSKVMLAIWVTANLAVSMRNSSYFWK